MLGAKLIFSAEPTFLGIQIRVVLPENPIHRKNTELRETEVWEPFRHRSHLFGEKRQDWCRSGFFGSRAGSFIVSG